MVNNTNLSSLRALYVHIFSNSTENVISVTELGPVNGIFYNRFKTVSLRFFYLIRVMPELNINWNDGIKKEARGLDGSDLGEEALQEVSV